MAKQSGPHLVFVRLLAVLCIIVVLHKLIQDVNPLVILDVPLIFEGPAKSLYDCCLLIRVCR